MLSKSFPIEVYPLDCTLLSSASADTGAAIPNPSFDGLEKAVNRAKAPQQAAAVAEATSEVGYS